MILLFLSKLTNYRKQLYSECYAMKPNIWSQSKKETLTVYLSLTFFNFLT